MRTRLPEEKSREEREEKQETEKRQRTILFLHRININTRRIGLFTYQIMEDKQRFEEVSFK